MSRRDAATRRNAGRAPTQNTKPLVGKRTVVAAKVIDAATDNTSAQASRLVERSAAGLRQAVALSSGPTFLDLFCGVGGFSLGCIQAGLRPLAAFDNDAEAVARYQTNLGPHAYELDLSHATKEQILAFTKNVLPDVLVGGPPCQGFSLLGKRDPTDERSALTASFARIVLELMPKAFAMENVPGIFSMGSIATEVRDLLRKAGYRNAEWVRVDASLFGVPQRRQRAVLLGSLDGLTPSLQALGPSSEPTVFVGDAIRGLPRPRVRSTVRKSPFLRYETDAIPGSYDEEMRSESGAVSGCQITVHKPETIERFKVLGRGKVDEPTSCKRLDPNGLAPALRAGSRDRTACRPVHPYARRVITVREAARLHSFPDWFDFSEIVSLGHVQIGNSVPPRLGGAIARWLIGVAESQVRTATAARA